MWFWVRDDRSFPSAPERTVCVRSATAFRGPDTLISGEQTSTLKSTVATEAALGLGASKDTAGYVGFAIDIGAGITSAGVSLANSGKLANAASRQTSKLSYLRSKFGSPARRSLAGESRVVRAIAKSSGTSSGAQLRSKLGSRFDEYARFRKQGFTPAQSKYLNQPYDNGRRAGHHFPITQAKGRGVLPDAIIDSQFNVLKPRDINLGRFYELHYKVDPSFNYARFPNAIGGGWNGNTLQLQRYEELQRVWYGTPGPTKAAAGIGAGAGTGAAVYWWNSSDGGECE